MITRREIFHVGAATAALLASDSNLMRAIAQQRLSEPDILGFESLGNITLLHTADIHGQLLPVYFREPSVNLGVGEAKEQPPHLTGEDFLRRFGIPSKSAAAYALTAEDFSVLAKSYGRIGGLDRLATVVKHVRAERGEDKVLLLDGGDTWQGSLGANRSKGQDMVDCMALLKPDAMTGHWEFTLGEARVKEIVGALPFPFLAQNIRDTEWNEPAFKASVIYERGGVKIGIIGQALPYTPVANPRWMIPNWSFGIREDDLRKQVEAIRKQGAELVVLLSHNGFDLDRKLASRVSGIDVILTAHTHDALPEAVKVGRTLLVASGSHGKFVSRLDLDVRGGEVKDYRYKLIPVFADAIAPDSEVAAKIRGVRAPYETILRETIGRTETLLYRRGNFNGTLDDLICDAILSERDAEIALSPGFRWGNSLLPGRDITREDIYNATAITYPATYRMPMPGARLKEILEDVGDNLFNPDPYYQQGGDMVRVGGVSYTIDIGKPMGSRISDLTLLRDSHPIEPSKDYVVAGWASVNEGTEGPPIWDVVINHVGKKKVVAPKESGHVRVLAM
jgi:sulfur-oxidizing protein SoxB